MYVCISANLRGGGSKIWSSWLRPSNQHLKLSESISLLGVCALGQRRVQGVRRKWWAALGGSSGREDLPGRAPLPTPSRQQDLWGMWGSLLLTREWGQGNQSPQPAGWQHHRPPVNRLASPLPRPGSGESGGPQAGQMCAQAGPSQGCNGSWGVEHTVGLFQLICPCPKNQPESANPCKRLISSERKELVRNAAPWLHSNKTL